MTDTATHSDVADDVALAVRQLGSEPSAPTPADTYQPAPSHDESEAALDDAARLAKRATDLIERSEPKEQRTEVPTFEAPQPVARNARGQFTRKEAKAEAAPDERLVSVVERIDGEIDKRQGGSHTPGNAKRLLDMLVAAGKLSTADREAIDEQFRKREVERQGGFEKYREQFKGAKEIDEFMKPRREMMRQYGFQTDLAGIQHLFGFSDHYQRDKVGLLRHLLQNDPSWTPQEREQLRQMVGAQGSVPQMTQQHLNSHVMQIAAHHEVQQFLAEAQNYPHFEQLRPAMQQLLNAGQAANVVDAYFKSLGHATGQNPAELDAMHQVEAHRRGYQDQAEYERLRPFAKEALDQGDAETLREAFAVAKRISRVGAAQKIEQKRRAASASIVTSGTPSGSPRSSRSGKSDKFSEIADDVRAALDAHR